MTLLVQSHVVVGRWGAGLLIVTELVPLIVTVKGDMKPNFILMLFLSTLADCLFAIWAFLPNPIQLNCHTQASHDVQFRCYDCCRRAWRREQTVSRVRSRPLHG
ncbi:unnamed protein product [Protopolystoma xenopodis]|uniref:Uncharacterized protein n=1 Tax=Protopolystoma xenopodis TaxID=117903 RepID=A0A3S5B1Z4_9PLAT|nr:unnamed protein product [Protopolystoma xenopodis]